MNAAPKRRHRMPRTPGQFLALSGLGLVLLAGLCGWNWLRYDITPRDTLLLKPAPERLLVSRANRHLVFMPFAAFIVVGGGVGAVVSAHRRSQRRRSTNDRGGGD